jgi:hypothetical protein
MLMKATLSLLTALALGVSAFGNGAALAAGPHGWRYSAPGGYYYQDKQVDRAAVEKTVAAALASASKGEAWKSPRGVNHIPLLGKDKLVIGNLWEDADLKVLEAGAFWTGRGGTRVELVSGGKVVGILWLQ